MQGVAKFVALVLVVSLSTLVPEARPQTGGTAASCDRKCLAGILDSYFDSIAKRDPALLPAAPTVRVTENAGPLKFGEGLWQRGASTVSRMDALDTEGGQVASMAVITENGKTVIEMVRLKVLQRRVVEVETLIVRPGEGQRSNPQAMAERPHPFAEDVPVAERGTREQLIAAAGAYLDALAGSGPSFVPPPIGDAAFRVENGGQATGVARPGQPVVTLAERFRTAPERPFLPPGSGVLARRYPVVDLQRGIALAIGTMTLHLPPGVLDGPPGHVNPKPDGLRLQVLTEFFKVSGGKIQRIEAVMYDLDNPRYTTPGWPVP
jgi:hypothetical protein